MWKIRKLVLAAVLVAVMVIGCTAGVAFAQEDEGDQGWRGALGGDVQDKRGVLTTRVAEILDIDQRELEDAFSQAQRELRKQYLESTLQELVDEGTLTQTQADELKAWIEARPDIPPVGDRKLQEPGGQGALTEEQADELKTWREARPDLPEINPKDLRNLASRGQDWREALMTRVAEIVEDIDQQELEDAFKQAQSELREQALDSRLEKMVDEGILTQKQADEFKAWIKARPDIPRLGPKNGHPNQPGGWELGGPGMPHRWPEPTDAPPLP